MDSDSDEPDNIYPICSRCFSTYAGVRVHWRIHTAEEIQTALTAKNHSQPPPPADANQQQQGQRSASNEFQCFECGVQTKSEKNFIAHVRLHLQHSNLGDTNPHLSSSNEEFAEYVSKLKQSHRLIKRIPKGARYVVANDFSCIVKQCIEFNERLEGFVPGRL